MMKNGKGGASSDLLVCFPSRAHLTLIPKTICSPARRHHHHNHHKKPGQASPLLWAKTTSKHPLGPEPSSEPTSPKVTCAGQIKVRPATASSCRNWHSVIQEIERIHNHQPKNKKPLSWGPTLGFKKEVLHFLTCLRTIRFDFRCFGSFPGHVTDDDDDDDNEEEEEDDDDGDADQVAEDGGGDNESKAVFSKWFMVLQQNKEEGFAETESDVVVDVDVGVAPPANALLLMRCRSAPVQSRIEQSVKADDEEEPVKIHKKKTKRDSLEMVMKYDIDFYEDVAEETWVVGGGSLGDPFSRSRSWKR